MKRPNLRYLLVACLLASAAFAAWSWCRPYARHPDASARCTILETLVTRDQAFFWVEVHLKVSPGMTHDLQKPAHLELANSKQLESADTTLASKEGRNPDEIWLKFWLEKDDLAGPLVLQLNDGKLSVKATDGIPDLENARNRNFTSNHW